jgi:hypothetical protein
MKLDLKERMMLILVGIGIRPFVIKLNEPTPFQTTHQLFEGWSVLVLMK